MKKNFKLIAGGSVLLFAFCVTNCSKEENQPVPYVNIEIGFSDVPANMIGGPTSYGENLYFGYPDQITSGYIVKIYDDIYAQFPVNYAEQPWEEGQPWEYTFFNGGMAVSNWHDMSGDTFANQLSVYSSTSPGGGNFVVSFGNSDVSDPKDAKLSDYDGCGKVYITNSQGYGVTPGSKNPVSGEDKEVFFNHVMIANTAYDYLVMKNGNPYASALNEDNKGWFKVQFIAFDDNKSDSRPVGYVETYLANFDPDLEKEAGFVGKIIDDWQSVDLSPLPKACILVVNFVGSDMGDFGLNTPKYCALDQFNFVVMI